MDPVDIAFYNSEAEGCGFDPHPGHSTGLGSNRETTFQQYHVLMRQPTEKVLSTEMLAAVIDAFLEWLHRNRAPDTYEWYRYRLQRLVLKYPEMRVSGLRPYHIERRPQELLRVTASHFDRDHGRWVFPQDQAKGKRAPRIIYLVDKAIEITVWRVSEITEGPIFRNRRGNSENGGGVEARGKEKTDCSRDQIALGSI